MPNLTLAGVVLGVEEKPYDFTNPKGERVAGTARSLWLWDESANTPIRVKVPEAVAGSAADLGRGEVVAVTVSLFAKNNRVEYSFLSAEAA